MTSHEVKAMSILILVAGLDTVAAALGFDFYHLARNQDEQALLRAEPKRLVLAAEEMLRAFSTITPTRKATCDVQLGGVLIKQDDLVACPSMTVNRDPAEFEDPDRIEDEFAARHQPPRAARQRVRTKASRRERVKPALCRKPAMGSSASVTTVSTRSMRSAPRLTNNCDSRARPTPRWP